jgi:Pregnancy-associated plasma protein-A
MIRFVISFVFALSVFTVWSQDRCGTVQYEEMMNQRNPKRWTKQQFENWLQQKKQPQQKSQRAQGDQQTQATYTVPVVVHVIHNGEPIGSGVNISDAQILSQLKVLNNDFNRLNVDQTNTPTLFQPVAGSFSIEFILAKQDPNGLATTGIVRKQGSKTTWDPLNSDNFLLKSQSYWPAEDYLNIWVTTLSGFLGYAQFPVANIPDLQNSSNERLTDGLAINYKEFGSIDDGAFNLTPRYNKGRTLTHEMGHFFGLYHVWGDGGCNSTDYVADTPTQSASTSNCPSHPQQGCTSPKMFQNYLDYTNDECMNLFTLGQASRMNIVLQNSVRRASLLTSIGSFPPSTASNDIGIKDVVSPKSNVCSGVVVPSLNIRNFGVNTIASTRIQLKKDNVVIEIKDFSLNLSSGKETQVAFSSLTLNENSTFQFDFQVIQTNGATDGNNLNDTKSILSTTPAIAPSLPLNENFNSLPTNWNITNPDGLTTWQTITASDGRKAIYLNFYDYLEIGSTDLLSSPVLDLTAATKASLVFDRAYSQYPNVAGEQLRILVSNNCDFAAPVVVYAKSDKALSTTTESTSKFSPTTTAQWVTEVVSLDNFIGQKIQVAFEGTNANGNNLYIDNVRIVNTNVLDIAITGLISPSPVNCLATPPTIVKLKNIGNVPITNFTSSVTINGQSTQPQLLSNSLASNEEKNISLSALNLSVGNNKVTINITQPNGRSDDIPENNLATYNLVLNNNQNIIPLRERFDSDTKNNWSIVSQGQQATWQNVSTNFSNSLVYNSFTNTQLGDESWLVSPVLDFSSTSKASMFFSTSYAKASKGNEPLRLVASSDCGVTFTDDLPYQRVDGAISLTSDTEWKPVSSTDWTKQFASLSTYAGNSSMRFAFLVTNGNGNNFYLDNIDFYIDDNPNQIVSTSPYAIYGGVSSGVKITFNLEARVDAKLQLFNTVGQLVSEFDYPNTLNQTYPIEVGERAQGIYIARVQIGNQLSAQKVFFGN